MNNPPRTILLATTAIATAFTLVTSFVRTEAKSLQIKDYAFPESVALSQWKLFFSQPVKPHLVRSSEYISGDFIAGKHYRYHQDKKLLDIEMRYFANTNGDLKSFITSQTEELSSVLKDSETGFYSVYTHKNKAYLSACINPHGISTVTSDRFNRNLMIHDTRLDNILPWLLGRSEFRDKRCLWAHLSMPLDRNIPSKETYKTLETVWFDWHDWWRSHYPEPYKIIFSGS